MGHLAPAAAAALGAPRPYSHPQRLAWVDLDEAPTMVSVTDPIDGSVLGQYARVEESLGLTDLMADKLRRVADHIDGISCEATDCVASPYERNGKAVGTAIGWALLSGDADERVKWRPVTLVQRDREVSAVCQECSPSRVYQALQPKPESE